VNQPVMDLATGRVYITSHNHGFAAALPGETHGHGQTGVSAETHGPGEAGVSAETPGADGADRGRSADPAEADRAAASSATTWSHLPPQALRQFETPYGPAVVSHVNLNDGVVEGLRLLERPVFSVQYHPEAAPGPHDAADHFDHFCTLLERAR